MDWDSAAAAVTTSGAKRSIAVSGRQRDSDTAMFTAARGAPSGPSTAAAIETSPG